MKTKHTSCRNCYYRRRGINETPCIRCAEKSPHGCWAYKDKYSDQQLLSYATLLMSVLSANSCAYPEKLVERTLSILQLLIEYIGE